MQALGGAPGRKFFFPDEIRGIDHGESKLSWALSLKYYS